MSDEKRDVPTISLSDIAQKTDFEFPLVDGYDRDNARSRAGATVTIRARTDWPTFWQSLTPAETAAALRAAPRVAGEWVEYADGYARDPVIGGDGLPIAEVTFAGEWFVYGDHADNGKGERSKECRDAADAALRAAGWVLL